MSVPLLVVLLLVVPSVLLVVLALSLAALSKRITTMSVSIDDLVAKVAAENDLVTSVGTLVDGAIALLTDFRNRLAAAGADQAKLDALGASADTAIATLQTKKDALTAAVPANTPAPPAAPTT